VPVEVKPWPQVNDDLRALPTDKLRWEALRYIVRLRDEPYLGRKLKDHPALGDLSDCRKIFLDEAHDVDPRWRIVYRLLPNEAHPEVADVIIVGPRESEEVYLEVMRRLERHVPARRNEREEDK
jgi:mRNA-degrading endonuclease YafQ of YafQ-DinJ toxin-antitoxin module